MDRAFDRRTDLAVLRTEARLKTIYKQASKEITDKMQTWQKGHEKRDKMYRQMVEDGKMSKDDYDAWMRGQVFQGEQWAARKAQIDNVLYNAENAAAKIVNENRIGVFTQNANRIGYELEHSGGVDIGFTLYDEATVSRLLKDNPRMLPPAKVQKPKAYSYYNRLVNNCVTQGIIQGESIDQIADRIVNKTGEASYSSAVRNARTSMTGAQNAGRIEGLHQAQSLGVKVQKQWLATLDDHTRDAHRELDGQIRDVDEPFEVNGLKIDYPGDPNADPSLTYNCRCTLTYKYPEYPDEAVQRRDNETGELIEDMTYREWEAMKSGRTNEPQPTQPDVRGHTTKIQATMDADTAERFIATVENGGTARLYERYGDECAEVRREKGGGSYNPSRDVVVYDIETHDGMSEFSTAAHEVQHMFDAKIGRSPELTYNEVDTINERCIIGTGRYTTLKVCPSSSDEFLTALRADKALLKETLNNPDELAKMKTGPWRNATAGVQDAMDGRFGTQDKGILPWGHGNRYYNRQYNRRVKEYGNEANLKAAFQELGFDCTSQAKAKQLMREYETASELWANCGSALTCGGLELQAFEQYMPNTTAVLKSMAGRL